MIIDTPRSRICDGCKTYAAVVDASFASASKKTRASSVENALLNQLSAAQLAKTVLLIRRRFRSVHSTRGRCGERSFRCHGAEKYNLKEAAVSCAQTSMSMEFVISTCSPTPSDCGFLTRGASRSKRRNAASSAASLELSPSDLGPKSDRAHQNRRALLFVPTCGVRFASRLKAS